MELSRAGDFDLNLKPKVEVAPGPLRQLTEQSTELPVQHDYFTPNRSEPAQAEARERRTLLHRKS